MNMVSLSRRLRSAERGAAMIAVIGLMLVGMVVTSLILSSIVSGFGSTTSTRAGVQSQAAATAGVDVALAALTTGTSCSPTYTSSTAPTYTASLSYTTASSVTSATAWVAGCPTADAQFVKITSVGAALSKGVAGNSTGNTKSVEAIYNRAVASPPIGVSGPAIYSYSSQYFGGSGTLVSQDGTNDANVMVKTGDVSCSGGAASQGDLVVNNGNVTLSGSCGVLGNLWASGTGKGAIKLSGGVSVGGNAIGSSLTVNSGTINGSTWTTGTTSLSSAVVGGGVTVTAGAFSSGGSNAIGGDIWSSGASNVTNGDAVKGNATAQTLALTGGNIGTSTSNRAWARGSVTGVSWYSINAALTAKSVQSGVTAQGGVTVVPAGPGPGPAAQPTPAAPTVPNWINFAYSQSDWAGFSQYNLGTNCDFDALTAAVNSFAGGKGIIDARGCTSPLVESTYQRLILNNDLVIISTLGFSLGNGGGFTSDAPHKLWLITPDTTSESPTSPTCPAGSSVNVTGAFYFSPNLSTIIYSPCKVYIGSGINFYGQVFAGGASVDGNAHLYYTPVGLPGYDLSTGASSATPPPNPWTPVSLRNIGG
ncbi:hypothetical protein [Parafrigoribacterium soli]|uniref:hypothetical protein n=1 Tax=Parafrigoribacterium soli TaxID=3144663 RepID=UPI0032EFC5C9